MYPMRNKAIVSFLFMLLGISQISISQNLDEIFNKEKFQDTFPVIGTFKGTRISIGHSVETRKKGSLEIVWMNRFWNRPLAENERTTQTFAADKWNSRIGIEYAPTDQLTLGTGYGTYFQSLDVFGKYKLANQRNGIRKFPFTISIFQNAVYRNDPISSYRNLAVESQDKWAATTQLLIARKFSRNFSFQIAPSYVYRSIENTWPTGETSSFSLGFGARYNLSNHVSVVSEYYYNLTPIDYIDTYGPFSLGVNWEVSKLLLQFKLTNARDTVEDLFISKTTNNFNFRDGNLHFGFHATYFIQLSK